MSTRPYVICHVFAGLNGRIDGAYMFDSAASVFDEMPQFIGGSYAFSLEHVELLSGDGLHLVYRVRR